MIQTGTSINVSTLPNVVVPLPNSSISTSE